MQKIWKAKWICSEEFAGLSPIDVFHRALTPALLPEHREELKNRHTLIRKTLRISQTIQSAQLDISADDYYKLYLNGKFVGQGPAPSYAGHYAYNTYHVGDFLHQGVNVIAVHVYYQGLINRVWNSGDYRQGMIAELSVNGGEAACTGPDWKYSEAREFYKKETFGYETGYLESIDFRLKQSRWKEAGFDDTGWKNACVRERDDHILEAQPTPSVEVRAQKPARCLRLGAGHFLLDFGVEFAGQFRFCAQGKPGQKIELRYGEELDDVSGGVRFRERCNCDYRETLILSGGKDELESYDYKAFRYVEILAPEGTADPQSFGAVVRHYPVDENKSLFRSSDGGLNAIWNICRNAVVNGTQEGYLDCPGREKGQYLGDLTITAQSHLYVSGDLRIFRKALLDFSRTAFISPGLMCVAPCGLMQEFADYSLLWPYQLLVYYRHSGEKAFLKEMLPAAEGLLGFFKKYRREDGLLENVSDVPNLVDWPENFRDGYDADLTPGVKNGCHNVLNALYCGAVKCVDRIRDILGKEYSSEYPALLDSYRKAFYDRREGLFRDSDVSAHSSLHSNAIALFYGLAPQEAIESMVSFLRGKRMECSVYFAYFLLKGLAAAGEYELEYDLMTCRDPHSWRNMIAEGATTCFEAWGKDQKWNTSLCHPWASCFIPTFIEDMIGLYPAAPGWRKVGFRPHLPVNLTELEFRMETQAGTVAFSRRGGKTALRLPEGAELVKDSDS